MSCWRIKLIIATTFLAVMSIVMFIISTSPSHAQECISSLGGTIKERYDNITPMYIHFVTPIDGDDFGEVPFDFTNDSGQIIAKRIIRDLRG